MLKKASFSDDSALRGVERISLGRRAAYRSFWPQKEVVAQFGERDVDLVCVFPSNTLNSLGAPYCAHPPNWIHQGIYDWNVVDRQFDELIEANAKAKFLCMVDLNTPPWLTRWCLDREDSFLHLGKIAASEEWRKMTDEYLEAFLKHVGGKYGDRIEGYILMCGMTDEWQDCSRGEESASRKEAWRKWSLDNGYCDPIDIPPKAQRDSAARGLLRDPQADAVAIRYSDFTRWLIADAILHFAAKAQTVIRHGAELGVFFGYIFEHASNLTSLGHLGFDKVFASPDIDFIISPSSYRDRQMGGASIFMLTLDSLKLHGKHFIREIDHFTHTANGNPLAHLGVKEDRMARWNHRWTDEKSSIAGLRRELAFDLVAGDSFWWFDMWNHWYETEGILAEIKAMKSIWDAQTAKGIPDSTSQIAVLADAESCLYLNEQNPQIAEVLSGLRLALGRTGAPYSIFSFADIESIDFSKFKLVILPNLFLCNQERLEKLKRTAMKNGMTILWIHLAGVITDGKYDESNVEKLTGLAYAPGKVAEKDFGSWKSVLHSDLNPSAEFIRAIAKAAGVHLYGEPGEPVYANSRLLASHSASGGMRKFRLPRKCNSVRELFSGRLVATDCVEFEDRLDSPGTVLYELE